SLMASLTPPPRADTRDEARPKSASQRRAGHRAIDGRSTPPRDPAEGPEVPVPSHYVGGRDCNARSIGSGCRAVRFGERNEEVQTLAPNGAHKAFAKCVCLRGLNRRPEDRQAHRRQRPIHSFRVNAVAIVNHIPMRLITRNDHAELLRRPFGGWMCRRVPMQDASGSDFEDHEHVHHATRRGDRNEEIARQKRPGRGSAQRCLRPATRSSNAVSHVAAYIGEPFAATPESQASRGAPRRFAPRPKSDWLSPSPRSAAAGLLECVDVPVPSIATAKTTERLFDASE